MAWRGTSGTVPLSRSPCRDVACSEGTPILHADALISDAKHFTQRQGTHHAPLCTFHRMQYQSARAGARCSRVGCQNEGRVEVEGIHLCRDHAESLAGPRGGTPATTTTPTTTTTTKKTTPRQRATTQEEGRPAYRVWIAQPHDDEGPRPTYYGFRGEAKGEQQHEGEDVPRQLVHVPALSLTFAVLREAMGPWTTEVEEEMRWSSVPVLVTQSVGDNLDGQSDDGRDLPPTTIRRLRAELATLDHYFAKAVITQGQSGAGHGKLMKILRGSRGEQPRPTTPRSRPQLDQLVPSERAPRASDGPSADLGHLTTYVEELEQGGTHDEALKAVMDMQMEPREEVLLQLVRQGEAKLAGPQLDAAGRRWLLGQIDQWKTTTRPPPTATLKTPSVPPPRPTTPAATTTTTVRVLPGGGRHHGGPT